MMKSLGHKVFLYGAEENEAECDEHVVCVRKEQQKELCGPNPYIYPSWVRDHPVWVAYNAKVIKEIGKRQLPGDFICILGGNCHIPIVNAFPSLKVVEYGIGYKGHFSKWRVWESHVWRGYCLGKHHPDDFPSQNDTVIPSFYRPEEFVMADKPEDYALYVGRVTKAKGVPQACEAAEKAGVKLKVIGFGDPKLVTHGAEYLGCVPSETRNELMSKARAVIAPTLSWEPFGNVACEAQMCGTPVVCSNWGGFVETVEHGLTGWRGECVDDWAQGLSAVVGMDRTVIRARAISLWSVENVRWLYQRHFERLSKIE